jgi:DNA-binding CsgD family transcriptional regulator
MNETAKAVRRVLRDPFFDVEELTKRERQVATLAARNLTNDEIAESMNISSEMATQYVRFVLMKVGVHKKNTLTSLMLKRIEKALTEEG